MSTERWRVLSEWHNTWLAAPNDQRAGMRASFATEHPDLLQLADELAASSGAIDGFLETPALVLAARDLVQDEPPLPEDTLVGPYRIVTLLARGGMGDVYRATDQRLGRDVALKTLTSVARGDGHSVERFQQEARITASLDHPNIVRVFDVGMSNGRPYLVSELLDGETLRAPIGRGPLAPADARSIAAALTSGLVAAHARGLVHRDLKPENIFLTKSGTVKILDFGIAKLAQDPALPRGLATLTGVVLGTAGYLAPEQVKGDSVDGRTDLFALGSILFELMTGQRAFVREHTIDTLHAIVHDDPPDLLPPGTPMTAIVSRLLAKAPEARFQSAADLLWALEQIDSSKEQAASTHLTPGSRFFNRRRSWVIAGAGDARFDIEDALTSMGDASSRQGSGGRAVTTSRRLWARLAVTMAVGAIVSVVWFRPAARVAPPELRRVSAELGTEASLVTYQYGQGTAVIISPNGEMLAFIARPSGGGTGQIYVRQLDQLQAAPLAGTDGALNPFFSPDNQWIAFFADGKLKKIPALGGGAVTICTVLNNRGGTWSEDGRIVFSPDREAASLWQVSSSGGEPQPLIALGEGEMTQRWPQMLRGGSAVLFTGNKGPDGFAEANVVVQSLPNGPRKTLVPGAYFGRYLQSGHLLYVHDATLFAAPFDLERLEMTGAAAPVLKGAAVNLPVGSAEIAMSDAGTIAYLPTPQYADNLPGRIDWLNRDGTSTPLRATPARWLHPRFSPDGHRLAFDLFDGAQHDLWTYDWSRDKLSRVTFESGGYPVWTPDARRIVFTSARGIGSLYWQQVDGGETQRLTESNRRHIAGSWDPSGRILAFTEYDTQSGAPAIMLLRMEGDNATGWRPQQPTAFITNGDDPIFSPDGRWMAYVAKEPGRVKVEVYVRPFPGSGGRWEVSSDGGDNPAWSLTRRELIYATPDQRIMAVPYSVNRDSFHAEKPRLLPNSRFAPRAVGRSFDLHPDGNRMALVTALEPPAHDHVILVFNFSDILRAIAPLRP